MTDTVKNLDALEDFFGREGRLLLHRLQCCGLLEVFFTP